MQTTRLRQIGEDVPLLSGDPALQFTPPSSPAPSQTSAAERAATTMLLTALRTVSQRALIALGNLFVLATAASAWWLWLVTLPQPSIYQLVGLGLYGILIILLNGLVLRRR